MADTAKKEDEALRAYKVWKQQPTIANMTATLEHLQPSIDKALHSYGYAGDANMRATAQLHLLKALPTFDPQKSNIHTFALNELRRLQRLGPQQSHAIPMPEQSAYDLRDLQGVQQELEYTLGREATHDELADASGLSVKRIAAIKSRYGVPTMTEPQSTTGNQQQQVGVSSADPDALWTEAVYGGLDAHNKKILDWSLGLHGEPQLSKTEMAKRLKISIPAVSQRAQKIHKQLSEGLEYRQ